MGTDRHTRVALIAVMFALAAAAGCSTNPATGRKSLRLISVEQEIAMGREAAPQFEAEFGGEVANETLQRYVRSVGARVAEGTEPRGVSYDYALLASNTPNAFALPGGKVYVTAGLMLRMSNERELAAVLGHESGHVAAEHNVSGMQRQMGAELLAELAAAAVGGSSADTAKVATKVVASMVTLKYSRGDEYEADQLGIRYMARAGYNPWGMVELLTTLLEASQSEPGSLGEMFQTHPLTRKRIDRASQQIRTSYRDALPDAPDPNAGKFMKMRDVLAKTLRGAG